MLKRLLSIVLLIYSLLVTSVVIGQNTLKYEDYIYSQKVKTVQLSPVGATHLPAVAKVRMKSLELSFDLLGETADYLMAKIISCDRFWKPSDLSSLDYLSDYNEFNINTFEFSFDDKVPYVHFTFEVPAISRSGNYLLVVHHSNQPNNILITRRVRVVQSSVQIMHQASLSGLTNLAVLNQQINFTIKYPQYKLENPLVNVNVVIRQNQRDDNAVRELKPAFVREDIHELEYRFFDHQNSFAATNEFRFFDMKSLIYPGQNIHKVIRTTTPPSVAIALDHTKRGLAYAEYIDRNGQFAIATNANINGLYAKVTFGLEAEGIGIGKDIYVFGELSDWKKDNNHKMDYDPDTKLYYKTLLLKEGFYEYQYLVKGDKTEEYELEGNHAQAENDYEILVYYKPPSERTDLIIGYISLSRSGRNR